MRGFIEEKMRALPLSRRPCVHYLKKRISFKSCTNEYRCVNCEFDQYFYDEYTVHAVVKPVDLLDVQGFKIPQGYYLHHGHAWAKIEEGSSVRVGIDDFALRLLGPLDSIEAPLIGKGVRAGEPHAALRRGTKQARLLSPVSGVITAVNPKLRTSGTVANQSPYSDGWVMAIHTEDVRKDLKCLMIGQETEVFLNGEVDRLHQLIEEVAGPPATDGGHLGYDLYGMMPLLGWERLAKTFLRT
jgi:glycine cleavage system H lipoate-binding protein